MGDDAEIVQGARPTGAHTDAPSATQRAALYSTVHGAGRVMSRTTAAGKLQRRTRRVIVPGRITPEVKREWVEGKGVALRGGGPDESPHVYRRLPAVLAAQEGTVEALRTLRPLVVLERGGSVQGTAAQVDRGAGLRACGCCPRSPRDSSSSAPSRQGRRKSPPPCPCGWLPCQGTPVRPWRPYPAR